MSYGRRRYAINWMLDNPKRIKDYEDYNIIEMLALLKVDNTHREFLLTEIKRRKLSCHFYIFRSSQELLDYSYTVYLRFAAF